MKKNLFNIFAYIQGYTRYRLYYSDTLRWLLPTYIYEQILWRISVMDLTCYEKGSCKMCGCDTTALQMANKSCDKPCYPKMMTRKVWEVFKKVMNIKFTSEGNLIDKDDKEFEEFIN